MSVESNKAACLEFWRRAYQEGHPEFMYQALAGDAVDHELEPFRVPYMSTAQLAVGFTRVYLKAFPDLQVDIEDMLGEEDRVMTRWRMRGTQTGPLMGIEASGRPIDITGLRVDRFVNGKIAETWGNWDLLGLLEQIGALPPLRRGLFPALRSLAAA
ncbi:MAG TPA: ester cyclase [Thermoanaerobaculia bacterium]|nr:ester cyclase [Thermoanaerobaculia bacterium]